MYTAYKIAKWLFLAPFYMIKILLIAVPVALIKLVKNA